MQKNCNLIGNLPEFPPMVALVINNVCNYSCRHCYYKKYKQDVYEKPKFLSLKIIKKVMLEMKGFPEAALRIIAWGEPLLHPNFVDIIKLSKKIICGNPVTIITNGYLLDDDLATSMMENNVNLVEISIDAFSEQLYHKSRITPLPNAFGTVKNNVINFIKLKQNNNSKIRIVVSFILYDNDESKDEYQRFEKFWKEQGVDEIIKRPVHSFKGIVNIQDKNLPIRPPCYCLWSRCTVNPFGEVSVCYNDWERFAILGDLNKQDVSLKNMWQNKVLHQYRNEQQAGVFRGICSTCKDYNPNAWQTSYDDVIDRSR